MADMSSSHGVPKVRDHSRASAEISEIQIPSVDYTPAQFVAQAREVFLARNHKLNGAIPHDAEREARIDRFVETSALVRAAIDEAASPAHAKSLPLAATRLLRCFERLCFRTNSHVADDTFREHVYRYLVEQLVENTRFFRFNPKVLVTPTLMSKVPLTELPDAALSQQSPEATKLFYRAFTANPQSIERFFSVGKARLIELQAQLEHDGRKLARLFQITYAYFQVHTPVDVLLSRHFTLTDSLCREERFKSLPRSLVQMVVGKHKPDAVRDALERIVSVSEGLMNDPRVWAVFGGRPSDIVYAAAYHTRDAKCYLLRVAETESRLTALYQALGREFSRKELRLLCLKDPARAEEEERELEQQRKQSAAERADAQGDGGSLPTWML